MEFKSTITGANIVINIAPFAEAMRLKNSIQKELARVGIDLSKVNWNNLFDSDVLTLISPVLSVDSSEDVQDALMACMGRCLYNNLKIDGTTFDPEKAREDYYDIVLEVLKINLSPFFRNLRSRFEQLLSKNMMIKDTPQ